MNALLFVVTASSSGPCLGAEASGSIVPVRVPEASALAVSHYRSGNVVWMVSTFWTLAVPAVIFFSGFSARLRTLALRASRRWYVTLLVYLALAGSLWFLADFPLDFYADYIRPHTYGLSSQTFGKWLNDELLFFMLAIAGAALVFWLALSLMQRFPTRWWLYAWLAVLPIMVFIAMIEPIWVEPLFNQFGPMKDKALEARILNLAARAGIDATDVYEVNKSVDTNELNAYVTGIGATKRIVLWDTTLKEMSAAQVEVIMAHEMGHYVLRHVWKGLAAGSLLILPALWLVHLSAGWIVSRSGRSSGVHDIGDMAGNTYHPWLEGAAGRYSGYFK